MEPLRKQVIATSNQVNDLLDKPSDPAAGRLRSELKGLENDLQSQKNPVSIEDRVKRIIGILDGEAKTNQIMDPRHINMFRSWFSGLRETLRKMG